MSTVNSDLIIGSNKRLSNGDGIFVWNNVDSKVIYSNFVKYGEEGGVIVDNSDEPNKHYWNYSTEFPTKEMLELTSDKTNIKPTHIVRFYDNLSELDIEDFGLPSYCDGEAIKEDNCIVWVIDIDTIEFSDLIENIICDFNNPHLIISPEFEIILDFRLKVDESQYYGIPKSDIGVEEHV